MGQINIQGGSGRFGMDVADEGGYRLGLVSDEDLAAGHAPIPDDEDETTDDGGEGLHDPGEYNVDDVLAYLDDADEDERTRVLDAERAGKARVGIIGS